MLDTILKLYIESLKIHIGTKTKDHLFHEFTQDVYELLFDVFHETAEKMEDIEEWEYTVNNLDESKQRIYDLIEEVKTKLDSSKWEYTTWYDNLLRWLVDKLEFLCWNARSFICEEVEEEVEEEIKQEKKETKETKKLPSKY